MAFSDTVLEHFREPRKVGTLLHPSGEGWAGSYEAGQFVRFQVRVEGDSVQEARFQTYGCVPAIAAGSWLAEWVEGKSVEEALGLEPADLERGLGGLPPRRRFCAALAIVGHAPGAGRVASMLTLPVVQATPRKYAPVRNLVLYVTRLCNLRCTYCFVEKTPNRMSLETARKAVDFFLSRSVSGADRQIGINFFGGEPFTEMELLEQIVAYARERRHEACKNVQFAATTNGTVATPRLERLLRENRMRLLVSLDGSEVSSRFRPFVSGKPSWPVVARNLPRLAEWSPGLVVRMTFHPQALNLVENVQTALDLGARSVALCPVVDAPWHLHGEALEDAFQALADRFISDARAGRLFPLEITGMLLRDCHRNGRTGSARPSRPCGVGNVLLSVDPDGNVMPCHRFLDRPQDWLGTVEDRALPEERWRYVHLASSDIEGCAGCSAAPVCGGGCRVIALDSGLGLHGAHPGHCQVMRAHARAVFRIYETLAAEANPVLARVLADAGGLSGALAEMVN